jgi:cyanophycin synthetase
MNKVLILETKILKGPNVWSFENSKLIVLKLQLNTLHQDELDKLIKEVIAIFPGISSEYIIGDCKCMNTVLLIKHIAIQLQGLAGMSCKFGKPKVTSAKDEYFVAFEYTIEPVGTMAGEAAVRLVNTLLAGNSYQIENDILMLKLLKKRFGQGPTTAYILKEVEKRNIPIRPMIAGSLVTLGYGKKQKKLRTAVAETTSGLGIEIAGDKDETKNILADAHVPVPKGIIVYSEEELKERIGEVAYPLALKPLNGNQGRGVTTHIYDLNRALFGFKIAQKISKAVIVEEFIGGDDHRFLVINYKLVAATRRSPAAIVGDGVSTIQQLIEEENKDPQRGDSEEHVLAKIIIDDVTRKILSENKLELSSVLIKGQKLVVKDTANISAGGTATDLTDVVHPENKFLVERIARLFCLDICGVDIITSSVETPITRKTGAVIEVNAGPGVRMHTNPQHGVARNVAAPIIDMLFPVSEENEMLIIAIAESSVSGAITEMLASLISFAGLDAGYNSSRGLTINGHKIKEGECMDHKSIQDILFDPFIDVAILECNDLNILSSGLGFQSSSISIISGSTSTHPFPLQEVNNADDLLKLRKVVALSTKKNGTVLLDADDETIFMLSKGLDSAIALFSLHAENTHIQEHRKNGGIVAFIEDNLILIYKGDRRVTVCSAYSNSSNTNEILRTLLITTLAAHLLNLKMETIREGLNAFSPLYKIH